MELKENITNLVKNTLKHSMNKILLSGPLNVGFNLKNLDMKSHIFKVKYKAFSRHIMNLVNLDKNMNISMINYMESVENILIRNLSKSFMKFNFKIIVNMALKENIQKLENFNKKESGFSDF